MADIMKYIIIGSMPLISSSVQVSITLFSSAVASFIIVEEEEEEVLLGGVAEERTTSQKH